MSENSNVEKILGDSDAVESGEQGLGHFPAIQIHVSMEEQSNPSGHSESSTDSPVDVGDAERIGLAQMGDSVNQESSSMQVEFVDQDDGVLVNRPGSREVEPEDAKVLEDSGKEDMFVDAPDELSTYDVRTPDSGRQMLLNESQESSEDVHDARETQFRLLGNRTQVHHLIEEVESLRAMLEKAVGEKEVLAQQRKEERETFAKELAIFRCQLQALTDKQSLIGENDGRLLDQLQKEETGDGEINDVAQTPLHEMINGLSESLKSAIEERLQTQASMRELDASLYMKDEDIRDLNAKVVELSLSRDVIGSYLNSLWSESLEVASEAQLKKEQRIEAVVNRMFTSFSGVINQGELLDNSVAGKISLVEKKASLLLENYTQFLSEIDQLRQCLTAAGSDHKVQEEFKTILVAARDELLELRKKEATFVENLSHLEGEKKVLVDQLDKEKGLVESMNAELGKIKIELEQEKVRCANTREKLSMAVTKGKSLVQHRDSLKQSLAEKTSELEKCLVELQDKSSALQAAELRKEELINKSDNLALSLQEALSQRDLILEKFDDTLSQVAIPDGFQSLDITEKIRWLVDEKNALKDASLELSKVKDALSLIDLPETVSPLELESQVNWLGESFYHAKNELCKLQDYVARTTEIAHSEIDRLTASLMAEIQEKSYLQMELDDLTCTYERTYQKEHQLSLEKDQVVKMLLEASGIALEDQEDISQNAADMPILLERCFRKMNEQNSASYESVCIDAETHERILTLLYIRDQELMLCVEILQEECLERSKANNLLDELRVESKELAAVKQEKDSLQKDLERSEEKYALVREKLTMAVKKGKGLVQDRENLKGLLDEKNKEMEKLKLELQQQESAIGDYKDQINRLSTNVERIPKLEMDLAGLNNQRDQLENFLMESDSILQKVIESVDGIVLPEDSVFDNPVEKVKWLAGNFNECQAAKAHAEQELRKVREEYSTLAIELEEARTSLKEVEDALSVAENNTSRLAEEKRELEAGKTYAEQELQKTKEEAHAQTSRFAEACATKKSLEDALSMAENNIYSLTEEKEYAYVGRAAAEAERQKVKEEVAIQTSKLEEAYKTIKSLEDALSQVESKVALLTEENNNTQVGRTYLENELVKLKDEVISHAGNLAGASSTIKSLEDELAKAGNNISVLLNEKEVAEGEISILNSKLNACMEELSGTHGSLESRSAELINHLKDLQVLANDKTLLSSLVKGFGKQFEKLKGMDTILKSIGEHFVEMGSEALQKHPIIEEDSYLTKLFTDGIDKIENEMNNSEVNAADGDNILSQFGKIVEGLHLRRRFFSDKFEDLSTSVDEYTAALLGKMQATRDDFTALLRQMGSLKQEVKNLEVFKLEQEDMVAKLETDITNLVSACSNATKELQFEIENKLLEPSSVPELEVDRSLFPEVSDVGLDDTSYQERPEGGKHVEIVEKLLLATRKVHFLVKQFEDNKNASVAKMGDLQNELEETRKTLLNAIEERDRNRNRVSELESDVEGLQNLCKELRLEVEDHQTKDDKLKEREAEVSSLQSTLLRREQEREDTILSASQVRTIFEKISDIEISFTESEVGDLESHSSNQIKKLFCIIDNVTLLQQQRKLLSHEKEELQATLAKQVHKIEHVDKQAENMKRDLLELAAGLGKIVLKLGGNDIIGDQNSAGVTGLLPVLEKLVMSKILESESSKSKAQELGAQLLGSQKVVDDLSNKVKLLEESHQSRIAPPPEIIQDRGIFEAPSLPTGSEISEIEDVGTLGKNTISPVTSAAQMRTTRKGSTDHLVLDIDSEADRLISNVETDEDKGHVFKSLNTSGLIPIQGKMIADRIDGLWVSGSRLLMNRPRARLGLLAYWLFLHLWLLASIL